jgi:hypothetical protein
LANCLLYSFITINDRHLIQDAFWWVASQAAGKLPQLRSGARFGSVGLLPPLHYHGHGAGIDDLGATVPVSALSGERELSAGVCPALPAG